MEHNLLNPNTVTLKFFITDVNILNMNVDLNRKFAEATYVSHEKSASPIMPKESRHYNGLQKRLQIFMQSDKLLPELIDEIEAHNIHVDYHHNLNITVIR